MKRRRWWWAGILVAGIAVIGWMVRSPAVLVDLAEVVRGPVTVIVAEEGIPRVRDRYVVAAPISGRLEQPLVEAGDSVSPGGLTGGEAVEIRSGVAAGERVIIHPDERVTDGRRVAPRPDR